MLHCQSYIIEADTVSWGCKEMLFLMETVCQVVVMRETRVSAHH